jgi:hypothetical protein
MRITIMKNQQLAVLLCLVDAELTKLHQNKSRTIDAHIKKHITTQIGVLQQIAKNLTGDTL